VLKVHSHVFPLQLRRTPSGTMNHLLIPAGHQSSSTKPPHLVQLTLHFMKVMYLAVPVITFKITRIHTDTYFPFMPIKSSKTNKVEL